MASGDRSFTTRVSRRATARRRALNAPATGIARRAWPSAARASACACWPCRAAGCWAARAGCRSPIRARPARPRTSTPGAVRPRSRSSTSNSPSAPTVSASTPWNCSVMPSRSPTICSVVPAARDADSHPPNRSSLLAVEAGNRRDRVGERRRARRGIGEAVGGPVDGDELERHLLRDDHQHLLQLGFRRQAHQPHLAARRAPSRDARPRRARAPPTGSITDGSIASFFKPGPAGPITGSSVWSGSGTSPAHTTMWNSMETPVGNARRGRTQCGPMNARTARTPCGPTS